MSRVNLTVFEIHFTSKALAFTRMIWDVQDMKRLLPIVLLMLSCSTPQGPTTSSAKRGIGKGNYPAGTVPIQYMVGAAAPDWKMRNLINEMVRVYEKDAVAVAVTPYSQALVETSLRENPGGQTEANLKEKSSYYLAESCFIVEAASMEEMVARFQRWDGRVQEVGGKTRKLRFRAGTFMKDLPVATKKYFPKYEWENSTLACAPKIDFSKPFKVSVTPPGVNEDTYDDPIVFSWNSD
jgi:hypothetical protein